VSPFSASPGDGVPCTRSCASGGIANSADCGEASAKISRTIFNRRWRRPGPQCLARNGCHRKNQLGRVAEFLNRMSNIAVDSMPMVHTTPAYNLRSIFESQRIRTMACSFFKSEQIAYFFFGRPAYKWETESEAADWELPVCFVFEYDLSGVKRVFPFDSGAFLSNRLPRFLTMMPIEQFDIANVPNGPSKLVGAYFTNVSQYYKLKCASEDSFTEAFTVESIESEVRALHKLYSNPQARVDDRRATIEMQFSEDILLKDRKLLAIILPDIYLEDSAIVKYCRKHRVEILPYDAFPLNSAAYTAIIYSKLKEFYRRRRYVS
jgi:hypothetical protein